VEAYILCNLGRSHLDLGQAADGAALLEQALAIHRTEQDKYGQAAALKYLGQARFQGGQASAARAAWAEAVRLMEALSDDKQAAILRARLDELGD
jgi:predicted negative regulator of RcsB-dependent stress response